VSGHTKWSDLRDRMYAEHPGMAERVAARLAEELAQLPDTEAWEVELKLEPEGVVPPEENLRDELAQALRGDTHVLDADIDVQVKEGTLVLLAVLVLAVVGISESSKRFSQAGKSADILRLRLEGYGSVLQQTIRRAA
jgi:hypothetical protein